MQSETLAACACLLMACGAPQASATSESTQDPVEAEAAPVDDSADPAPAPNGDARCVAEGGTAFTLHEEQCCEGLTFLLLTPPPQDGECIETPPGPSPGICVSTCGDASCDPSENPCNCRSDCPLAAPVAEAVYEGPEATLCGCGCCGGGGPGSAGSLPPIECVASQAEFNRRVAADRRASQSSGCRAAGCSLGVRLRVCSP